MPYLLLLLAIGLEVGASLALKASEGFSRLLPGAAALAGFGASLFLLAQITTRLPLSLTYPTWAGLGIVGATIGAMLLFGETVSLQRWLGIVIVVIGIVVMYLPTLAAGARA
ncbi:QacE family quaternary ammonium compound efflux SMR transporter [Rhodobacter sp. HX-7-19]|uniref:QacE family quaternary ammonium compound efflux SMR transporter n=1 Tax=Paragemmobacter kunshanensis TaxID=2583234 RepID=A0A6M1TZB3_9RHOB|nr:SMR family transporter [Rhodobacter kunshanensis]NGQ92897.1 QacE family quaternary ammonium compound efflux SMR transporter [Rhodobacter kunshanensis]